MYGSNKLAEGFCPLSDALWQGSNSKIENYGFGRCGLLEKILQPFWHVNAISHCADNGFIFDKTYSSLVSTHTQMIFPNIAHAHCPESRIFANLNLFGLLGTFK